MRVSVGALPTACGTIRRRARRSPRATVPTTKIPLQLRSAPLAKTPRTWTGARTPSGLKRVRQAARRHEVLGPRRSAAKTYVAKALTLAANPVDGQDPTVALTEALSALDRAAKAGAIHPNAAARRKSRLTRKVNAALGGASVQTSARVTKQTGKAAAAEGRQGAHRGRQVHQGQGRSDRCRQGPRRAEQDGPRRGCRSRRCGRRGEHRHVTEAPAKATKAAAKPAAKKAAPKTTKAAAKPAAKATTAKPTATAKAAPKKKAAPKE